MRFKNFYVQASKLVVILFLLFIMPAYAIVPKNTVPNKLIYCPDRIDCDTEGDIHSCKMVGGDPQYWNNLHESGRIEKGAYLFSNASTSYQSPYTVPYTSSCNYTNIQSGINKFIGISSATGSDIEAVYEKNTSWNVNGYGAGCSDSTASKCPMTDKTTVGFNSLSLVYSIFRKVSLDIYVNNMVIKSSYFDHSNHNLFFLTYDEAAKGCGSVSVCKIEMVGHYGEGRFSGTATIDLSNNMKIVSVETDSNSAAVLKKQEPFNTIQFFPNHP